MRITAQASAEAEAIRITTVASATARSVREVSEAIREGGDGYLRYRQLELLPEIAPAIAEALGRARLVTIAGSGAAGGAAGQTTDQIGQVIQMVLATQLVTRTRVLDPTPEAWAKKPEPTPPAVGRELNGR